MSYITLQRFPPFAETEARRITGSATSTAYAVDALGRVTVDVADSYKMMSNGWTAYFPGSAPGALPVSGTTLVDFGSFPGSDFATVTLNIGQAGSGNAVPIAFVSPVATADHSADEHLVDGPIVSAVNNGDGTLTIKAVAQPQNPTPIPPDPMPYGKWTVGWGFMR